MNLGIILVVVQIIIAIVVFIFTGKIKPVDHGHVEASGEPNGIHCSLSRWTTADEGNRVVRLANDTICHADYEFNRDILFEKIRVATLENSEIEVFRPFYRDGSYGFWALSTITDEADRRIRGNYTVTVNQNDVIESSFLSNGSVDESYVVDTESRMTTYPVDNEVAFVLATSFSVKVPLFVPKGPFVQELKASLTDRLKTNAASYVRRLLEE